MVWQVARVPVLLGLLVGVGRLQVELLEPRPVEVAEVASPTVPWLPWLAIVVLGAAFVGVALPARAGAQGGAVAGVEVALAGVLALVPPIQWLLWFGFSWFTQSVGATTGTAAVQGLAVAWLVIAARALLARGGQASGETSESGSATEQPGAAR